MSSAVSLKPSFCISASLICFSLFSSHMPSLACVAMTRQAARSSDKGTLHGLGRRLDFSAQRRSPGKGAKGSSFGTVGRSRGMSGRSRDERLVYSCAGTGSQAHGTEQAFRLLAKNLKAGRCAYTADHAFVLSIGHHPQDGARQVGHLAVVAVVQIEEADGLGLPQQQGSRVSALDRPWCMPSFSTLSRALRTWHSRCGTR